MQFAHVDEKDDEVDVMYKAHVAQTMAPPPEAGADERKSRLSRRVRLSALPLGWSIFNKSLKCKLRIFLFPVEIFKFRFGINLVLWSRWQL